MLSLSDLFHFVMQPLRLISALQLLAFFFSQFQSKVSEIDQNMEAYVSFQMSVETPLTFFTKNPELLKKRSLIISQKSQEKLTYALGYGSAPVKNEEGIIEDAYSVRVENESLPFLLFPVIDHKKDENLYISIFIDSNEPINVSIQLFFTNDSYIFASLNLSKVCNLSYGLLDSESLYVYTKITNVKAAANDELILHNESYQQFIPDFTYSIAPADTVVKTIGIKSIFELASTKTTIWANIKASKVNVGDILILKIIQPTGGLTGNIVVSNFLSNSLPNDFDPSYPVQYYRITSNAKGTFQSIKLSKKDNVSNYQLFLLNTDRTKEISIHVNDLPESHVSMDQTGKIAITNDEVLNLQIDNPNQDSFILLKLQRNIALNNYIRGNGDYNKFNSNEGTGKVQEFKIRFENQNSLPTFIKFLPSNGIITSVKYRYFNNTYGINIPSDDMDNALEFKFTQYLQLQFPKIDYAMIECLLSITFLKTVDNQLLGDLSIINDPQQPEPPKNLMGGYTFKFDIKNLLQNFILSKEKGDFISFGLYKSTFSTKVSLNGVNYMEFDTERIFKFVDSKALIDLLYFNVAPLPTTCNLLVGYASKALKEEFAEPTNLSYNYTIDKTDQKNPKITLSNIEQYLGKVTGAEVEYIVTYGFVIERNSTYYTYEELFNPPEGMQIMKFEKADNIQFSIRDDLEYYIQLYATEKQSNIVFAYNTYIVSGLDDQSSSQENNVGNHELLIVLLVLLGIFTVFFVAGLILFIRRKKEVSPIDSTLLVRASL